MRLRVPVLALLFICGLWGCGFNPGTTSQAMGTAGSTGTGTGGGTGGSPHPGRGGNTGTGGLSSSSGSGGDVGITGAAGMSCGQTNVAIQPEPPDILIVQDKSLSMNQDATGQNCNTAGCSKWSQVSAAIDNVVMATQTTVNWGLMFFGSDNMCGVSTTADVPIATGNYSPIQQAFATNQPSSYTPTESAVNAAVKYMQTLTDPNPKYLLLATDGLPNCVPGGRSATTDDSPGAETAVTNAAAAGFKTFVVGIATTADQMATQTLNTMAVNGGEPQTGAATQYYAIMDTASLETALTKIVGLIASCTIPLTGAPPNLSNVAVSAQDSTGKIIEVPNDPANGWSYTDATMTSIVLTGTACSSLQSGAYSNFQFIYACAGTKICVDHLANGTCGS